VLALALLTARAARADEGGRPRLAAAVGAGATLDDAGLTATKAVPTFFAMGGVGVDWPVGFELSALTSSAEGRYDGTPVDRLGLDGFGVLRPFAWEVAVGDPRWRARFVRATGLELGLGVEHDATTTRSATRFGLHTGVRFELPLGIPGYSSDLRLRLAVRRLIGFSSPVVQGVDVGDTVEIYTALVSVF
jgi:hypothetical protein